MTDDELTERLRQTLSDRAAQVHSPPDSWDDISRRADRTLPLAARSARSPWLPGSAVAVAVAVAAAALFFVLRAPGPAPSKVNLVAPPSTGEVSGTGPASIGSDTSTVPATTAVSAGPVGGPVPKGFSAVSVTFVSERTGWALGTAPCASPPCTSIVRTSDGGRTWVGIPAPRTALALAPANSGISLIRFANLKDGWAFGVELWATHDGGAQWNQLSLPGPIMDLEAADGRVHAVVPGPDGNFLIETSPVATDTWTAAATELPIGAGPVPSVRIVLQGHTGWVLENDRVVIAGARLAGTWQPWRPPCLTTLGPAALTASSSTDLAVVCDENVWGGPGPIAERAYVSTDGGATFHPTPAQPSSAFQNSGISTSPAPKSIIFAAYTQAGGGSQVLVATFDGGTSWATVARFPPAGQWLELGFTSPSQGVAVVYQGDSHTGVLSMTYDGGHTWSPVTFRPA